MVTKEQTTLYRYCVVVLIGELRTLIFLRQNKSKLPTDAYLAELLGLSATAFSSICRSRSSMSGVTLQKLIFEIAKLSAPVDFATIMSDFIKPLLPK